MPEFIDAGDPGREYRALIDGRPVRVVGHLPAGPHHLSRGTMVDAFDPPADPDPNPALYVLVSVQWATEVTTVDTDTSAFVEGAFGTPRGVSWYLTPVVYDQATGAYALAPQAYAAGPAIGALHEDVIHVVRGAGYAVPTAVRVYDFPLH
ncbi:hypothetical protein [Rhodococcus sp. IEGM 1307]|uniref:hypothetical protein n=1 Tax=Rhodococcus sp. IEGM 1307 TaxID=3047091 RepID=UPI0024B811B5|nr:hypothetical protein [Rhodococcus sp. IEGM 1307]MDI9979474.1 hypothetical protein [Rhodococcus sp. IEGM 1307]